MSITVTVVPTSPYAAKSVCKMTVAGATANDDGGYNAALYPASPETRYYLAILEGSAEKGRSYEFAVNDDGGHVFNNYIFPDAGSYTVNLNTVDGDSTSATASVTVQ
jgi:hypothetical protein